MQAQNDFKNLQNDVDNIVIIDEMPDDDIIIQKIEKTDNIAPKDIKEGEIQPIIEEEEGYK